MKIGSRRYIFEDNGSIRRIGVEKFQRFFEGHPSGALPEYAGKEIRTASVAVGLLDRKPARLLRVDYGRYRVDAAGVCDAQFREALMHVAVRMTAPVDKESDVVEAVDPDLARMRYDNTFRWSPSPDEEAALRATIFGV